MASCENALDYVVAAILKSQQQKYVLQLESMVLDVTKPNSTDPTSSLDVSSKYGSVTYNMEGLDGHCFSFVVSTNYSVSLDFHFEIERLIHIYQGFHLIPIKISVS